MEEKKVLTLEQALEMVGNRLLDINIPASMTRQIGLPILECAQMIGDCIKSLEKEKEKVEAELAKQAEQEPPEIVPLELPTEPENLG